MAIKLEINRQNKIKLLRYLAEDMKGRGFHESALYWSNAADKLAAEIGQARPSPAGLGDDFGLGDLERKEVMTVSGKPKGLYHKYFVLNLWTDKLARKHARGYARDVREKNPQLAEDLEKAVTEAEAHAELTEEIVRGIM